MTKTEQEKKQPPQIPVIYKTEDTGWQTRTEIALDKVQERSVTREKLRALEDFVNRIAQQLLGDRFMSKPEIKAFVAMLTTSVKTSWGGGIAEKEPRGLANLNAGEWFFEEYTNSRRSCTIYNLTGRAITAWDPDTRTVRSFEPGKIIRYGEDNPLTIQYGMYCLRLLHHDAIRTLREVEGRPQTVVAKDVTTETRPSWETPAQPQPPRTPSQ